MNAGVVSFVFSGIDGIELLSTDASDGVAPYTYQWQRNEDGGSFSNLTNGGGVTGATSLSLMDGSALPDILYGYRCVFTDDVSATATSNTREAQLYEGGSVGTSVYYFAF